MRVRLIRLSAVLCGAFLCLIARSGIAATDAAATFTRKCASCHTVGHGVLVGPDLEGATERHTREWLIAWIGSSESLIRAGDPAATALFNRFKRQRMPDQSLTSGELSALVDYLASGGPDADALKRQRKVDTATPVEIEMGRSLFVGQRALANGGAACFACHRIGESAGAGGTLGPDLSSAYARYRDRGMTDLLASGCFPRARPSLALAPVRASLTDDESFALKAFLRSSMKVAR
jgi:cytochrome c2